MKENWKKNESKSNKINKHTENKSQRKSTFIQWNTKYLFKKGGRIIIIGSWMEQEKS